MDLIICIIWMFVFLSQILLERKYIVSMGVMFLIIETVPYMSLSYYITAVYCVLSIKYVSIVKPSCAIMSITYEEQSIRMLA